MNNHEAPNNLPPVPDGVPELPDGWVYVGIGDDAMGMWCSRCLRYRPGTDNEWDEVSHCMYVSETHYAAPIDSEIGRKILAERDKPSWGDAPDWAEWLAQDKNGRWRWYSAKPIIKAGETEWDFADDSYDFEPALWSPANPNWRDTLERRPGLMNEPMDSVDPDVEDIDIDSGVLGFDSMLNIFHVMLDKGYRISWDRHGLRGWKR